MARLRAGDSDELKLEKLRLNFELDKLRIIENGRTQRFLGSGVLATFFGSLATVAWAAVRLLDKPAWLVFGLAILTSLSGPILLAIETRRRLKREVARRPPATGDEADQPEDGT